MRDPGFPCPIPQSGRATLWVAGLSLSFPAWPAELGPTGIGQDPRLSLRADDRGFWLAQPLQDWRDLEGVLGQAGVWFFPAACMRMA